MGKVKSPIKERRKSNDKKKFMAGVIALLVAFTLGACNNDDEGMNSTESRNQMEMDSSEDLNTDSEEDMNMEGMNHSGQEEFQIV
ncbi:MAG: hypothetical protein WBF39_02475 [Planococcus donghaensis]